MCCASQRAGGPGKHISWASLVTSLWRMVHEMFLCLWTDRSLGMLLKCSQEDHLGWPSPAVFARWDLRPGCTLSVCGAGWPRGSGLVALWWVPQCPDMCWQPLPLKLGGCSVPSPVPAAFAWLWCGSGAVCQPASGGVWSPALWVQSRNWLWASLNTNEMEHFV